ncbi:hypothetical protein [Fretibacter rubidus]|uniref:hypothetical protein n=1 Tax=Fretibacter rubidus TaxID=570162 RepID=UPI00352ACC95
MSKFIKTLPYVLAAGFVFFGVQKFGATNPVFEIIADRSGIDLFEPLIRRLTGVAELTVAALLLVPNIKIKALGALGAIAVLLGAIGFHLSPWLGINVPGIGHALFIVAVAMLALSTLYASKIVPGVIASNKANLQIA